MAKYVLEEQVGYIIRIVQQRHTALFSDRFANEITPTQWAALSKLSELGECSQNLLGRHTAMDVATIQGVIERLRKRGLVDGRPAKDDKRRIVLSLTPEGEALVAKLEPVAQAVTETTLEPLSKDEQAQFIDFLTRLS